MGSALFGWAFTITKFAKVYAKKFGIERAKMMLQLCGDNYYD
jgi:elongation factor 2